MSCRFRSIQSDSGLRCCGLIEPQASSRRIDQTILAATPFRTLCATPGEVCGVRSRSRPRAHPFAWLALTARQVNVGSTRWRPTSAVPGNQTLCPALWADYAATTPHGPTVSSRRQRRGRRTRERRCTGTSLHVLEQNANASFLDQTAQRGLQLPHRGAARDEPQSKRRSLRGCPSQHPATPLALNPNVQAATRLGKIQFDRAK